MADQVALILENTESILHDEFEFDRESWRDRVVQTTTRWLRSIQRRPLIVKRLFRVQTILVLLVNLVYVVYWCHVVNLKIDAPYLLPEASTEDPLFQMTVPVSTAYAALVLNSIGILVLLVAIFREHGFILQFYWVVFEFIPSIVWFLFAFTSFMALLANISREKAHYHKMYGLLFSAMVFKGTWASMVVYNYAQLC